MNELPVQANAKGKSYKALTPAQLEIMRSATLNIESKSVNNLRELSQKVGISYERVYKWVWEQEKKKTKKKVVKTTIK